MNQTFDSIIIGSGAAGLTSSIYLARYRINHLVIGNPLQSQVAEGHLIENYLGFKSIPGSDLIQKFVEHAESYGTKILNQEVIGIVKNQENDFIVKTKQGETFTTKTLILALGAKYRRLEIPGEEEFLGKGVTYCATCDAPLFKEKIVAVIGGGNSALTSALLFSEYAKKVYLIYRGKNLSAEAIWVERIKEKGNIVEIMETSINSIIGNNFVEKIELDKEYKKEKFLFVQGVSIEIGSVPATSLAKELKIKLDNNGYIEIENNGATNISGVFAAGDIANIANSPNLRQIIVAASEGAIAAASTYEFLKKQTATPSWGEQTSS